jgi:hypothetical protein
MNGKNGAHTDLDFLSPLSPILKSGFVMCMDASEDGFVARLYDFNQVVIKRDYSDTRTSANKDRWLCQKTGTVLAPGTIFEDLVETRLPYRSQVLSLKDAHNHCLALCSEDHIIIVDVSFREKCSEDFGMLTHE